jgi:phosphatidylglycerophosphate synthase
MFRVTARQAVRICVRSGIHPDWVSYASVAASVVSAVLFWQSGNHAFLLLVAPLPSLLRLWLNMLDGMVALASGTASRRGEILNDLPDRVSDWLVFAGIAHSGWSQMPLAYWAGAAALIVAYIGTFGQAVGAGRQYGGIMAKPWRMVAVTVGAVLTWAMYTYASTTLIGSLTAMEWALVIVLLGSVQSAWVRLRAILRHLDEPVAAGD